MIFVYFLSSESKNAIVLTFISNVKCKISATDLYVLAAGFINSNLNSVIIRVSAQLQFSMSVKKCV